jgi:hypothetical protein
LIRECRALARHDIPGYLVKSALASPSAKDRGPSGNARCRFALGKGSWILGYARGASVFELPVPGVSRCRGPWVSRLACPCGVFSGGAGRGDRGSSGCPAPGGRPVRPLCPGLRVLRAVCFRDRGSSGADIATFDPQSRNSPVTLVDLFCFMAVRPRSAGCSRAGDPRSRARTAGGPQGTGPATGRRAGSGAPIRSETETAANAGLPPDRSLCVLNDPRSFRGACRASADFVICECAAARLMIVKDPQVISCFSYTKGRAFVIMPALRAGAAPQPAHGPHAPVLANITYFRPK